MRGDDNSRSTRAEADKSGVGKPSFKLNCNKQERLPSPKLHASRSSGVVIRGKTGIDVVPTSSCEAVRKCNNMCFKQVLVALSFYSALCTSSTSDFSKNFFP